MNTLLLILMLISQGFMVQPDRIEVEVAGGKRITRKLVVTNISSDTIFIRVHVEKFDQDSSGKIIFKKVADDSTVVINPLEFNLAPGDNKDVRITLSTPYDMPNEIWGMIIFSQLPPPEEKFATIRFVREIGVPYYLVPLGTFTQCDIDTSFIRHDSIFFLVSNTGLRHLRAKATYKLENVDKKEVSERTLGSVFILPEHSIYLSFPIDTLKNGKYVARLKIDYGGAFAIEGVKSFVK